MSRPDPKTLCRYCGEPLPPRIAARRGRPAVTHEGNCRRLYTNRRNLEYRIARYRAAMEIQADRSTVLPPWIRTVYDYDDVAEGYNLVAAEPLWGKPLMEAVEAWEASERTRRRLETFERDLEQLRRTVARTAATRRVAAMDPHQRAALLERGIARHKRRWQ